MDHSVSRIFMWFNLVLIVPVEQSNANDLSLDFLFLSLTSYFTFYIYASVWLKVIKNLSFKYKYNKTLLNYACEARVILK